jgi:NADH dehydrogenase
MRAKRMIDVFLLTRRMLTRVVILGCGFGGLFAARALRNAPVDITVVDRSNHHLFQPLLYQVATAGLAAPASAEPIRRALARQKHVTVLYGEAQRVDVGTRRVILENGEAIGYDPQLCN